ncbi:hypothetical protein [Enterovibrio calviensis]|uniref:hypothetical protein n=1 Tax=Enterovibrio calviensis TaxID=91359 RepID=UPI000685B744|nr:hypothetical protein [Enterovibrio calviensis]
MHTKQEQKTEQGVFNYTLFFLLALLASINGLTGGFISWSQGLSSIPINPVLLLAFFSIIYLHFSNRDSQTNLIIPCCILAIFSIIPSSLAAWVGLLLAIITYRIQTGEFKEELAILFMLALSFIWQNCLFKVSSNMILNAETWIIGKFLSPFYTDLYVDKNHLMLSDGHNLSIGIGCSVFSNFSFVLLGWMCIYFLIGYKKLNIKWIFLMFITLAFMNIMRIGIMSIDYPTYVFVHDGWGAIVYNFLLLAISASPLVISFQRTG